LLLPPHVYLFGYSSAWSMLGPPASCSFLPPHVYLFSPRSAWSMLGPPASCSLLPPHVYLFSPRSAWSMLGPPASCSLLPPHVYLFSPSSAWSILGPPAVLCVHWGIILYQTQVLLYFLAMALCCLVPSYLFYHTSVGLTQIVACLQLTLKLGFPFNVILVVHIIPLVFPVHHSIFSAFHSPLPFFLFCFSCI